MKIIDKIISKKNNRESEEPITIVCLGDSVTEGCFECYVDEFGGIGTVFERHNSYSSKLQEMLSVLYPTVQFNIINSGFSGGCAVNGLKTLERDVLRFSPDLVVVSYGLNDCGAREPGIDNYEKTLSTIFEKIKEFDTEIIFLTQNYMCTKVSPHLKDQSFVDLAKEISERQNTGVLEAYFKRAKDVAKRYNVEICDLYPVWQAMEKSGVDTTELLSNKFNHPIREYHYYIAIKLIEKILGV